MSTWRRFIRWAGFEHTGPARVRAKHWWQWRKANRLERYLNWKMQQPEELAKTEQAVHDFLINGHAFRQWP